MNSEEKSSSGPFGRRGVRWLLLSLVWVITIVALFYAEEDWRGRRSWQKYRQHLESQGIPVSLASLVPKTVPDDQNFAMTPALAPLFDFVPGTQQMRDKNGLAKIQNDPPQYKEASNRIHSDAQREGEWARGKSIDLQAWWSAYDPEVTNAPAGGTHTRGAAAKAVLAELQEWTPLLDEIRAASQRPYSRFNIRYEEENTAAILLPHLAVLKRMVQALDLRAAAELEIGQTAQAMDDVDLAFKITNAVKDEPILITLLVRMSEARLILQPIWEGMAAHKWSEEQLKQLQQELSRFDFLPDAKRAFNDDRAAIGNESIEFVRKSPSKRADMIGLLDSVSNTGGNEPVASIFLQLMPSGWFYREEVEYNRLYDEFVMPLVDTQRRLVSPELATQTQQELNKLLEGSPLELLRHHRMFSRLLVPAVSGLAPKIARTQTAVDLGATACALERYYLAKGHYPEKLAELVPAFLEKEPNDVINGQPLKYRTESGRFVLYSVGWNGKDDGGEYPARSDKRTAEMRGTGREESEPGDWVWRYSAG